MVKRGWAAAVVAAWAIGGCGGGDGPARPGAHRAFLSGACGNGVRDPGEQCDDGNGENLDGCDAQCAFEQTHRINSLQLQFATDGFCPANALGGAVSVLAQSTLQSKLDSNVQNGSITILLAFLGLTDLSGVDAPALTIGSVAGSPVAGAGYDGAHDLDWWYTADPGSLDAARRPATSLSGQIARRALTAGPGGVGITLDLGGGAAHLALSGVRVAATVGDASAPTVSTGAPPGQPAAEHLDPALVSFATVGDGQLCGAVDAASLAHLPLPPEIVGGGFAACSEGYDAQRNSMLDVLVGGCHVFGFPAITPTQPDQGGMQLSVGSGQVVDGCRDRGGASVELSRCLAAAGYSSYYRFTTERVRVQ